MRSLGSTWGSRELGCLNFAVVRQVRLEAKVGPFPALLPIIDKAVFTGSGHEARVLAQATICRPEEDIETRFDNLSIISPFEECKDFLLTAKFRKHPYQ